MTPLGWLADRLGLEVSRVRAVAGGDINDAFRAEVGRRDSFVKVARPGSPAGMLSAEAAGLRWLAEVVGGPPVPVVRHVVDDPGDGARALVLDWVEALPGDARAPADAALGRELAALHRAGADGFGLDRPGYIATLAMPSGRHDDVATHFATACLEPALARAVDRGAIDDSARRAIDRLIGRLPELVGPDEPPARLHGDLWAGNKVLGPGGRWWLVDPAAHGGHREVDLAMMRLFGGFDDSTFSAYAEVWPLAAGVEERVALWQLWPLLVHAALFGAGWGSRAVAVARSLV